MEYWSPGDLVVERHLRQGKIWGACPKIVVRDDPQLSALYTPPETVQKRAYPLDGGPHRIMGRDEDWQLMDWAWRGEGSLLLALPGAAHAVCCFWLAGKPRTLSCWYVNLQKPMRRTKLGFDTLDQTLDIVVSPDRSSWQWKDEDALQELQDRAVISREQADALYREGEYAIALLQAADSPYSRTWAHWPPDPAWAVPALPPNWDQPIRGWDNESFVEQPFDQ